MLDRLKDFAIRKGYVMALKKGVACPDCGRRVELPPKMPEGGLKARSSCGSCDWEGSLLDTFEFGRIDDSPLAEQPVGSRITRKGN